jgi:hypothetical protein
MPKIDIPSLHARIVDFERRVSIYKHAPAEVRARWEFDLAALKLLLSYLEK